MEEENTESSKIRSIQVFLDQETVDKLKAKAIENERTRGAEIRHLIKQHVKE